MTGVAGGKRTAPDPAEARRVEAMLIAQEFDAALDAAGVLRAATRIDEHEARAVLLAVIALLGRSSTQIVADAAPDTRKVAEELVEFLHRVERQVERHRRELKLLEVATMRLHVVNAKLYAQLFGPPGEGGPGTPVDEDGGTGAVADGTDQADPARDAARAVLEVLDAVVDQLLEAEGDADETLPPGIDNGSERRALLAAVARLEDATRLVRAHGGDGEGDGAAALAERLLQGEAPAYDAVPVDLVGACLVRAHGPLELLARAGTGGCGHDTVVAAIASSRGWVEVARAVLGRVGRAGAT